MDSDMYRTTSVLPMPMISGWVPSTIIEETKKVLDIMRRGSRELK